MARDSVLAIGIANISTSCPTAAASECRAHEPSRTYEAAIKRCIRCRLRSSGTAQMLGRHNAKFFLGDKYPANKRIS
jgi:hypothetical protein